MKTFKNYESQIKDILDMEDVDAIRSEINAMEDSGALTLPQWEHLMDMISNKVRLMVQECKFVRTFRQCYHVEDGKTIVRATGITSGDRFKGTYKHKGMTYGIDVPVSMLPVQRGTKLKT